MSLPYPGRPLLGDNLDLAAVPTASRIARAFTKSTLEKWQAPWLVENGTLIVAELVTNAVRATGITTEPIRDDKLTVINLRILGFQEVIFFTVWDRDARLPVQTAAGLDSETGRGLTIVQALASRWGVYPASQGGKVVWAEVPVRTRQPNGQYRPVGTDTHRPLSQGELERASSTATRVVSAGLEGYPWLPNLTAFIPEAVDGSPWRTTSTVVTGYLQVKPPLSSAYQRPRFSTGRTLA